MSFARQVRLELKTATAPLHEKLEDLPCHRRLVSADCTLADYTSLLAGYAYCLAGPDRLLVESCWPEETPYQSRMVALKADLAGLGVDLEPLPLRLMPTLNPWGLRYVIEGMGLGAAWLRQNAPILQNTLVSDATQFFSLPTSGWPSFCRQLASQTEAQQTEVVVAAKWLFEQMLQHFSHQRCHQLSQRQSQQHCQKNSRQQNSTHDLRTPG